MQFMHSRAFHGSPFKIRPGQVEMFLQLGGHSAQEKHNSSKLRAKGCPASSFLSHTAEDYVNG